MHTLKYKGVARMKVLLLNGSAHARGCTARALREMARLVELGGLMEDDPDGEIRDHLKQIFKAAGMDKTADFFNFVLEEDPK